jgi:cysteine desulfurase
MNVYMDNNATTPLHPEVAEAMKDALSLYGNPSSMHGPGREADRLIGSAREQVAALINADPEELIFTSGGSEGNNTVLRMALEPQLREKPDLSGRNEVVVSSIEHPSALNAAGYLQSRGVPVRYLGVDGDGKADLEELETIVSEKTFLVSIMHGNNEIGTIQDIKAIAEIVHASGALMHTDAVQSVGKVPVDVKDLDVDYLSLSGHKLYGPKGVGALYVKKKAPYLPLIYGGHQEEGRRAGTYNTLGIIGLGKAAELAAESLDSLAERLWKLREKLKKGLTETVPDIRVNAHRTDCLPGTLDVSFLGAEGESILLYLDFEGIAVSTGSACATGSLEPSHVLLAIGLDAEYAHGSIRFSLGRENSEEDVDYVLEKLPPIIKRIRKMSTRYAGGAV